jgi:putative ABC transport system permease protein
VSPLPAWRAWGQRLAATFQGGRRERLDHELAAELEGHLALAIDDNLQAGMTAEEARRRAHLQLGGVAQTTERVRDRRGLPPLENLGRDLRFGLRLLLRNPAFTAVAVLTLALGIGANTAIFSLVHQLLLRPLPFPDGERLVMLWEITPDGERQNPTSRYNFDLWQKQGKSFTGMAAFVDMRLPLQGGGAFPPEEVAVQLATPELFQVLGVRPLLGRDFRPEDATEGMPTIALLGHDLWRRRFGGDPKLVGRAIDLDGSPHTVVGILPPGFGWHIRNKSSTTQAPQVWLPLPVVREGRSLHGRALAVVARLEPGVSPAGAATEMRTIKARIALESPEHNKGYSAEVVALREQLVGNLRPALLVLLGAVGLVLLIACANVANLLLARAAAREREIALRIALGAGRGRIVRQLLTESVLLSLAGALLGLGLAWTGLRALGAVTPPELAALSGLRLHLPVLGGTLALAVATGILFGLAPALEATRPQLQGSLKEGGRGAGGQGMRSRRLQGALVVAEVSLSLVLLAGAGLLVRSLLGLQKIDTGFATENVLTFVVRPPGSRYQGGPKVVAFFADALARLRVLPGVRQAGIVNYLPLYGGLGAATGFSVVGRPEPPEGEEPSTSVRVADPGYFAALSIPVLRGRSFTETEAREARHVILVNRAMAEKHFPGADPIGQRLVVRMFNDPVPAEIVGVVGDVRYDNLTVAAEPTVYFPLSELTYPFMTFVLRRATRPPSRRWCGGRSTPWTPTYRSRTCGRWSG